MPAIELDHPTGSVLTAYSLGQLSEPDLAGIDGHLAECAVCRQVVEGVAPDTLVALLRSADTDVVNGEAPMGATPPAALNGHPRYRVGELLGVGGMGAVYKAEHLLMERPVALKVLKRELIDRPATMERFRREVRAAARLTHPNIVAAFDAEQVEDVHFLVMEYVEGVSLAKRSAEQGPLPVTDACDYIRQAALGLQHAHTCGMVHRDIKPQNLMLTPSGQVKILDFGLARFASEWRVASGELREKSVEETSGEKGHEAIPEESDSSGILNSSPLATRHSPLITDTGVIMGTPDYIAPEQARDSRVADIRADIYSLGCTLYDLLAGHAPFPDGNATQKVKAHLERTPAPLRSLRRDVPVELARVVERMMAKDPAARYQTPAEVADALKRFTGKPHGALSRKRWLGLAGALGFVAALVAGVIIYVQTDHGTITVETNDDKIAVMIEKAGGVKIIDKANNREYSVRPGAQEVPGGDYRIEVSEALAGLDFQTKEFKLRRGKEVRLTAKFVAKKEGQLASGAVGVDRKRGEERLKILRAIARQLDAQHKSGTAPFEKVIQAKRDVVKAEAELAESEPERLKALESLAALAQNFVDVRKGQFEAGMGTEVELMQAKAELLEAQAALEREKNRVPTQDSGKPKGALYGGKAMSYWLEQLQDANPKFRAEAVEALGHIARKNKESNPMRKDLISVNQELIGRLARALGDDYVGDEASKALAALGRDAVPGLVDVLKEKASPTAVQNAASTLYLIGPDAKPAIPLLIEVIQKDKYYPRKSAILALGRIGPDAKDAMPAMVNVLGHYLEQVQKRLDDFRENSLPQGMLDETPASIPGALWYALINIDPQIEQIKPTKAVNAGKSQREFQQNQVKQWQMIYEALKKKHPGPMPQTDNSPGRENTVFAAPSTEPLYRGKAAAYWLDQLKDGDPKIRVEALWVLRQIAYKNKEFNTVNKDLIRANKNLIWQLVRALGDNDGDVSNKAAEAINAFGRDAIPGIVSLLKEKTSPLELQYAIRALQNLQVLPNLATDAKPAIPVLVQIIRKNNYDPPQRTAIFALANFGPEAKEAIPALADVLGDNLKQVQKALNDSKDDDIPSIQKMLEDHPLHSVLGALRYAITSIDPEIKKINITRDVRSGRGSRELAQKQLKHWQEAYETIRKKYPARMPQSKNTQGRGNAPGAMPTAFWVGMEVLHLALTYSHSF